MKRWLTLIAVSSALLACSAGWMAGLCRFVPQVLDKDAKWGRVTNRQRVLAGLAHFEKLEGELSAISEAAALLREELRTRWGGAVPELPVYAALA